jgi:hypothetical protein
MNGNLEADIELKKDVVTGLYSRFVEEFKVTIDGEIKNPGTLIILKD